MQCFEGLELRASACVGVSDPVIMALSNGTFSSELSGACVKKKAKKVVKGGRYGSEKREAKAKTIFVCSQRDYFRVPLGKRKRETID